MKHLISWAAAMIALAQALTLAPTSAAAQMQTYYHAGAWDAFSGRNEKGGATCGVGSTMAPDERRLTIQIDIGDTDTAFSVSKAGWSIPDNTRVVVVIQIGLDTPWTQRGTGHDNAVDWTLDPGSMQTFDQQFRAASSMTLTFPDGTEPPWTISLAGSTAISETFGRCVQDLTRQVRAVQPRQNTPPTANSATQPFSASTATPPPR